VEYRGCGQLFQRRAADGFAAFQNDIFVLGARNGLGDKVLQVLQVVPFDVIGNAAKAGGLHSENISPTAMFDMLGIRASIVLLSLNIIFLHGESNQFEMLDVRRKNSSVGITQFRGYIPSVPLGKLLEDADIVFAFEQVLDF